MVSKIHTHTHTHIYGQMAHFSGALSHPRALIGRFEGNLAPPRGPLAHPLTHLGSTLFAGFAVITLDLNFPWHFSVIIRRQSDLGMDILAWEPSLISLPYTRSCWVVLYDNEISMQKLAPSCSHYQVMSGRVQWITTVSLYFVCLILILANLERVIVCNLC